ncbi:hypothetical protein JGS22_025630 [Streptomyces sp. P38-E01]|uniref:Uncharacterized protein n=1 Tax=Streptomyces tardus TaxID=2780544 RepID=A0A949JRH1_9ACTN|nr:hypothetical protein [Streptomyces tardus]MBU7600909.1 hypothetical protein [Streptomyces tardus]
MARTRISISLDPEDAETIKAVAAESGLDVSAFLVMAGRREAARLARMSKAFSELDAAIDRADTDAEQLPWPPESDTDAVDRARSEIAAARAEAAARRREAAA